MNRRGRYRKFLFWCLGLDVLAMSWLGYRYMDRKVPDEIHVSESSAHEVQELLEHPLLEFEDAITVSGEGSYLLPCRLLGMIPFKDIKVTPAEAGSVYVSGSTVGIYMETEGVLIIDTGEILCEGGTAREPAKNIVRPGDYIVAFNEQKVSNKKELMEDLEILDGEDVILDVIRNGEKIPVSLTPVKDAGGEYKLGIWVRDNTQGIGTLTFVDEKGRYGALGHGISDVDTGELLPEPDCREIGGMIYRHAQMQTERKGENLGMKEMRKHIAWYTAGLRHSAGIRRQCNTLETLEELRNMLEEHGMLPEEF
mgnify:CR=1 FL=1